MKIAGNCLNMFKFYRGQLQKHIIPLWRDRDHQIFEFKNLWCWGLQARPLRYYWLIGHGRSRTLLACPRFQTGVFWHWRFWRKSIFNFYLTNSNKTKLWDCPPYPQTCHQIFQRGHADHNPECVSFPTIYGTTSSSLITNGSPFWDLGTLTQR